MQDRLPLGNGKNNKLKISIPTSITTVDALIEYLSGSNCYADVFANTDTEENAGASLQGTPLVKGTLLSSETAEAILGFDSDEASVDEVLRTLCGGIFDTEEEAQEYSEDHPGMFIYFPED
jgi:hypothetical protein